MSYNILFKYGTKEKFDALTVKDTNTLYFLDNGKLYKGNTLYSGGYEIVPSLPEKGIQGILYINSTNLSVSFWDGNAYQNVVPPITQTIDENSTDDTLATAKAIYSAIIGADATVLSNAKSYADTVGTNVKNELLGGAGEAYDTLKELETAIEKHIDAYDALLLVVGGKADKTYVDDQISTAKTSVITEAGINTDAKLSAKVGDIGENTVKTYVDAAKSEAIDVAASDATTKANTALSSAKAYSDAALTWVEI
ncbi:MAG: hypothetical protein LUH21_17660 [Clostridiales bacterium]|nr:hypothetical protein [Clostridiales bacterium]